MFSLWLSGSCSIQASSLREPSRLLAAIETVLFAKVTHYLQSTAVKEDTRTENPALQNDLRTLKQLLAKPAPRIPEQESFLHEIDLIQSISLKDEQTSLLR